MAPIKTFTIRNEIRPRDNGGLTASEITGIVIGTVSGILTIIGLIIALCAWKYPSLPPGRLGNSIRKQFSIHGGNARGGNVSGTTSYAGDARGGDVYAGRIKRKDNSTYSPNIENGNKPGERTAYNGDISGDSPYNGDFHGGNAYGGDATGATASGGAARGGDVLLV